MTVREATPDDAARLVALLRTLHAETEFMFYEPGEYTGTEAQQASRIEAMSRAEAGVVFVCEADSELIGVVFGSRGIARRTRHSLSVALGLRQSWVGQGVGRALLEALEDWARSRSLHRLELTVDLRNPRAIALYERLGFEREGIKRHSRKIDGKYLDELYMSKLLEV